MDLRYLAGLTQDEFESERRKIIANFIQSAPPERRVSLLRIQYELDAIREECSSEDFIRLCFSRITENLENISDQMTLMRNILVPRENTGIR